MVPRSLSDTGHLRRQWPHSTVRSLSRRLSSACHSRAAVNPSIRYFIVGMKLCGSRRWNGRFVPMRENVNRGPIGVVVAGIAAPLGLFRRRAKDEWLGELAEIRNRYIGFVFQTFNLLPRMSALENVELPLLYGGARDARAKAQNALETVGLGDRVYHESNQLSGGQRQRVAIARAIATDPAILLADEPTGNLDPDSSWEIMQLLDRIHLRGATVAVATHDSGMVDRMRKRVVAIEGGAIVRDEQKARYSAEPD